MSQLLNFKTIFQVVEPQYIAQTIRLANQFQGVIDPTDLNFNYRRALQITASIPNKTVIQVLNQPVIQQTIQVAVMVDRIMEFIRNVLDFAVGSSDFCNQVESAVTNAFTNLNTQENSEWMFFYNETSLSTSYYYNFIFAIQNAETDGVMVLPIGFDITVELDKQQALFLTLKDSARYEVTMKAITFVQALQFDNR